MNSAYLIYIFFIFMFFSLYCFLRKKNKTLVFYFNHNGKLIPEKNSNNTSLAFLYNNPLGKLIRTMLKTKSVQKMTGWYYSTSMSRYHIKPFIDYYNIDMMQYNIPENGYSSFNNFFIRTLKENARPQEKTSVICPTDGKVLAYEQISPIDQFSVKNIRCSLISIIKNKTLAQEFEGGTLFIIRLAPYDYHRFHFPLACTPLKPTLIHGTCESVNPSVFSQGINPYLINERHIITLSKTPHGNALLIPVGALFVGAIIETFKHDQPHSQGDEAGYFSFGGSSLLLLFKKNTATPRIDLIKNTQLGYETAVRMGESLVEKT